jgi:hypothetical protein
MLHLISVDTNKVRDMHRATCSCGFVGLYRTTVERARQSGEDHKAREAGEILPFAALAVQVGR